MQSTRMNFIRPRCQHVHMAMAVIQNCGFQLVQDPPYSPDLAPSDCYLVLKMKKELDGDKFARDDDVMNELWTNFLRVKNGAFYTRDLFAP